MKKTAFFLEQALQDDEYYDEYEQVPALSVLEGWSYFLPLIEHFQDERHFSGTDFSGEP